MGFAQAHGEHILMSSLLKALVEGSGEFECGEGRDVQLKGLSGVHQVHDVRWMIVSDMFTPPVVAGDAGIREKGCRCLSW